MRERFCTGAPAVNNNHTTHHLATLQKPQLPVETYLGGLIYPLAGIGAGDDVACL